MKAAAWSLPIANTLEAPPRSAVMIGNIGSRRTSAEFARARELLAARGFHIGESFVARNGSGVRVYVREAVKAGHELIIVAGGDGAMTSAVGCMAYTTSILGLLPFGTGNSFARSLGIQPDLERAVETIVTGKAISVDLGTINGDYFANFASIGISSIAARTTPKSLKRIVGSAAYAMSGLVPMLRSPRFKATISWDGGRKIAVRTHEIIVANGKFYGLVPILPNATIVNGKLSVVTTEETSRLDAPRLFAALFRGKATDLSNVEYFQASELSIKTKPKQYIDVDGKKAGTTPARFAIASKALHVIVPRDFTGE